MFGLWFISKRASLSLYMFIVIIIIIFSIYLMPLASAYMLSANFIN